MLTHQAFGRIPARQREDRQLRGSSALRGFWELQSEGCPICRIVCEKACPKRSRMGGASRLEIFQEWLPHPSRSLRRVGTTTLGAMNLENHPTQCYHPYLCPS